MIGEFLYALTTKDVISQPVLQRVLQRQGNSGAAVNVDALLPAVPPDRAFVVTNINGIGLAGAAQTTQRLEWNIISEGVDIASLVVWTPNPALQNWGDHAQVDLLLMPGEQLRCRGVFSAAGASNTVSAGAVGVFLPKGNLQLR